MQVLKRPIPPALPGRVQSGRLNEFLFAAAEIGAFVRSSDYNVDDRTLDFVAAGWRANALRRLLESAATSRKVTGTTVALGVRDEEIGQRRQQGIDFDLESYTQPFGSRLSEALASGWEWFVRLLLAGAHLWVFLLVGVRAWAVARRRGKAVIRAQPAK